MVWGDNFDPHHSKDSSATQNPAERVEGGIRWGQRLGRQREIENEKGEGERIQFNRIQCYVTWIHSVTMVFTPVELCCLDNEKEMGFGTWPGAKLRFLHCVSQSQWSSRGLNCFSFLSYLKERHKDKQKLHKIQPNNKIFDFPKIYSVTLIHHLSIFYWFLIQWN